MHRTRININIVVDTIAALSSASLERAVFLMDDSCYHSENQGTNKLTTRCVPGQLITWTIYALDLQTPAALRKIHFLGSGHDAPDDEIDPDALVAGSPSHPGLGRGHLSEIEAGPGCAERGGAPVASVAMQALVDPQKD